MTIREEHNLTIVRKKGTLPSVPFLRIKNDILGKSYVLTITFCDPETSRTLNRTYRDKDYPTNILSFPLDETQGEIYIQPAKARSDAKNFSMSYHKFLHLLVIHGCLHLLGHDHSDLMDSEEDRLLAKYYKEK